MSSRAPASIVDVAIVGGGLAGGLIALALANKRPELRVRLFEQGATLGGNHRWSWFETDLDDPAKVLLAPFRKAAWDGYMVGFPGYDRALETPYRSMASHDFDRALRRELPAGVVQAGTEVVSLAHDHVQLADQTRIPARAVVDCRAATPSRHLAGGWQVFMGRHLRTTHPHGIELPFIMDATVDQIDLERQQFQQILPQDQRGGQARLISQRTQIEDGAAQTAERQAVHGHVQPHALAHLGLPADAWPTPALAR